MLLACNRIWSKFDTESGAKHSENDIPNTFLEEHVPFGSDMDYNSDIFIAGASIGKQSESG